MNKLQITTAVLVTGVSFAFAQVPTDQKPPERNLGAQIKMHQQNVPPQMMGTSSKPNIMQGNKLDPAKEVQLKALTKEMEEKIKAIREEYQKKINEILGVKGNGMNILPPGMNQGEKRGMDEGKKMGMPFDNRDSDGRPAVPPQGTGTRPMMNVGDVRENENTPQYGRIMNAFRDFLGTLPGMR